MKTLITSLTLLFSLNSMASVELTNDQSNVGYNVCSEALSKSLDSVSSLYLEKLENVMTDNVLLSSKYRKAKWENTSKKWDKKTYPLYVRAPYWYLCAFNIETEKAIVFLHD